MSLLNRAKATLESLDHADEIDVQLLLTAMVGIIADLWESAVDASLVHQDILATAENGVRLCAAQGQRLSVDESQAIRSAIHVLGRHQVVRADAEAIRLDFVQAGFPPMGFME